MEGTDGVKTGYTKAAGRTLVSSAQRNGRRIVAVTLDAPDDWNDHAQLIEGSFSHYHVQRVVTKGDFAGVREVAGGNIETVSLYAADNFVYALADGEQVQLVLPGKTFVYAPAVEGADAGFAYVVIQGTAVGKVPLVFGKTVEIKQPESESLFRRLLGGNKYERKNSENYVSQGYSIPQTQ